MAKTCTKQVNFRNKIYKYISQQSWKRYDQTQTLANYFFHLKEEQEYSWQKKFAALSNRVSPENKINDDRQISAGAVEL